MSQNLKLVVVLLGLSMVSSVASMEVNARNRPLVKEYVYKSDIYDADFWEGFDKEEEPYEHDWLHIPDFINKTRVEFWFNITHHFLHGVERGVYMDDELELDE